MSKDFENKIPPPLTRQALLLASHIPSYVRTLLLIGARRGEIGYLLRKRPQVQVHGIEPNSDLADAAKHCLDSVIEGTPHKTTIPFPAEHFDVFLLLADEENLANGTESIISLRHHLKDNGHIFFLVSDSTIKDAPQMIEQVALAADFTHYHRWPEDSSEKDSPALIMLTPAGYDPLQHARDCDTANDPKGAFEILHLMDAPQTETHNAIQHHIEMQKYLLHWATRSHGNERLDIFRKSLELFNKTATERPVQHAAYRHQADCWRLMRNNRMARAVLRAAQSLAPNEETVQQLESLETDATAVPKKDAAPKIITQDVTAPTRILYIINPRVHYGLDVLYAGLCTVLGDENVVDYPYKPTLHGEQGEELKNYPCTFDRDGTQFTHDEIRQQLHTGRFDLILFGDCEGDLDQQVLRDLISATNTPLHILDALDECNSVRTAVEARLGRPANSYFKREMLSNVDYDPTTFPLPFAYPENRIQPLPSTPRSTQLFWAGHQKSGLRKCYIEHLQANTPIQCASNLSPELYTQKLFDTRIGLSCFGFGFDTVRYWELPAHGCALLSERPPIHIPHNFTNGENAIFFNDVLELEEKVKFYLHNPEKVDAIAEAGRQHLKTFHTASARARQLVAYIANL